MSTDHVTVVPGPPGSRFGEIRWYDSVGSANEEVLRAAAAGAPDGLVVVADLQTAGRGRLDRRWDSPAGANLLLTVLLRLEIPAERLYLATAVVAMAAADACRDLAGVEVDLKWPNDLLVADRKLGGLLTEVQDLDLDHDRAVVAVGLGLNVHWPPPVDAGVAGGAVPEGPADGASTLEGVPPGATSLTALTGGRRFDRRVLLDAILVRLDPRLAALSDPAGRQRLASEHRRRCATLGRVVRVETAGEDVVGTATDVTPEGHLLVDVGNFFKTVTAGDVVHLRESAEPPSA